MEIFVLYSSQRENAEKKSMIVTENRIDFCVTNLSNIDENIFIKKQLYIPIISNLLTRFQMYYTYRKARNLCSSIQVHTQPMKTFRYLFQVFFYKIFFRLLCQSSSSLDEYLPNICVFYQ
jgi:hypothetical protein